MALKPKLSEAVEEYVALKVRKNGREHNTVKADNNILRMFVRISGDRLISSVTPQHVEDFFYGPGGMMDDHVIDSKRSRQKTSPPISPASHNHYRSRLRSFFNWCVKRGYLTRAGFMVDVFDKDHGCVQVMRSGGRKHYLQPSPRLLLDLIEAADNVRDRAYLAVAANTGLRANEIRRLRIGDIDLEAGILYVLITKTGVTDRLRIFSDLDVELRRWLTTYTNDLGRPLRRDDALFPRRRGGLVSHYVTNEDGRREMVRHPYIWVPDKPIGDDHLIVKKAFKALGWKDEDLVHVGVHTIRRGVARAYFDMTAKDGDDATALRETAALLHHSSTATTEVYLGTSLDKERRDARMAGKPFLSALVASDANVVPLRPVVEGE